MDFFTFDNLQRLLEEWSYLLIFFATLIDSLPFGSLLVPEEVVMSLSGFILDNTILNFFSLWALASVGMLIGQLFIYAISRKYGTKLLNLMRVSKQTRKNMNQIIHSDFLSLNLLVRFSSTLRSIIGVIAGISRVNFNDFLRVEIITAFIKPPLFILIGMILSGEEQTLQDVLSRIGVLLAVVSTLSGVISIYISRKTSEFYIEK